MNTETHRRPANGAGLDCCFGGNDEEGVGMNREAIVQTLQTRLPDVLAYMPSAAVSTAPPGRTAIWTWPCWWPGTPTR